MKKTLMLISLMFLIGCAPKAELESALTKISALESQISQQDTIMGELEDQSQSLNDSLASLQSDFDTLSGEYDTLFEEKETLQTKYSDTRKELQSAEHSLGNLVCSKQIDDMVYENIFDVSTILAGWWVKQSGVQSVQGTYRDHIWSNADTKIHSIMFTSSDDNQQYVEHFLVFFDEFGWDEGIFWLSRQCWLDSPY